MNSDLPKRKNLRLTDFDYSQAGYYFVTICTEGRASVLCRGAHCAPETTELPPLSEIGQAAEAALLKIPDHYDNVFVDKYVIMPNHIHAILAFSEAGRRTLCAPTLSRVVKAWKEAVTKRSGRSIWQKGYYDHIIRDKEDYQRVWQYIEDNPTKWTEDEYYSE